MAAFPPIAACPPSPDPGLTESGTDSFGTTTAGASSATTGPDETSGVPTTSDTDGMTATTAEETSGSTAPPTDLPAPDPECAHLVEVHGAPVRMGRHITVDSTACASTQRLQARVGYFNAGEPAVVDLGIAGVCGVYGPADGFAAESAFGSIVEIPGPDQPPAYEVQLFVDLTPVDYVRIPAAITFPDPPPDEAPFTPVRRAEGDEQWSVVLAPVDGCEFLP